MKLKRNYKKAFTLIELLVVIAIGASLTAVLLPGFISARRYAQLDEDVTRVVIMIREAQEQSLYPNKDALGVTATNNFLCTVYFKSNSNTNIAIDSTFRAGDCSGTLNEVGFDFTTQTLKYSTINDITGIHFGTPFGEILTRDAGTIVNNTNSFYNLSDDYFDIVLTHNLDNNLKRTITVKKSGIIDLK